MMARRLLMFVYVSWPWLIESENISMSFAQGERGIYRFESGLRREKNKAMMGGTVTNNKYSVEKEKFFFVERKKSIDIKGEREVEWKNQNKIRNAPRESPHFRLSMAIVKKRSEMPPSRIFIIGLDMSYDLLNIHWEREIGRGSEIENRVKKVDLCLQKSTLVLFLSCTNFFLRPIFCPCSTKNREKLEKPPKHYVHVFH